MHLHFFEVKKSVSILVISFFYFVSKKNTACLKLSKENFTTSRTDQEKVENNVEVDDTGKKNKLRFSS